MQYLNLNRAFLLRKSGDLQPIRTDFEKSNELMRLGGRYLSSGHVYELYIFDLTGKVINTIPAYQNAQSIDVANMNQGIYLVKIKDNTTNTFTSHKLSILK
jgi:hypothetical protein